MPETKQTPTLSIVVPVYNVVLYLDECLESLLRQGLEPHEYEVIMVNDGSTDGSVLIAEKWARNRGNFHLINQKNAGLSAARNAGVEHSTGEFLTFLDSDDVIPDLSFKKRIDVLNETGSDFITGRVFRFYKNVESAKEWRIVGIFSKNRHHLSLTKNPNYVQDAIQCNKVYRRDFFVRSGIKFPEGRLYEDIATTPKLFFLANSFDVLNEPVYYWRVNKSSITTTPNPKKHLDRLVSMDEVKNFFVKERAPKSIMSAFSFFVVDYNLRWILLDLFQYGAKDRMELLRSARGALEGLHPDTLRSVHPPLDSWVAMLMSGNLNELDRILSKEQHIVNEQKIKSSSLVFAKKFIRLRFRRLVRFLKELRVTARRRLKKTLVYYVLRPCLFVLPLNSRCVVFSSYWGRQFSSSDAPPSICIELAKKNKDMKCVVFASKSTLTEVQKSVRLLTPAGSNIAVVKNDSIRYFYHVWTAKYLFNDVNFALGINTRRGYRFAGKRRGQVEIQTTHGTPLKKLGIDATNEITQANRGLFLAKTARYDYLIASSPRVAKVVKGAFGTDATILKTGLPQNDGLFRKYSDKDRAKIKQKYSIDKNKKIVVYTPTYRYDKGYAFRYLVDMNHLYEKLGDDYQIIVKPHPFNHTNTKLIDFENLTDLANKNPFVRLYGEVRRPKNNNLTITAPYKKRWSVTQVPADINELLLVADALVLDYSSIMFNSSHLDIPTIFFTPDIDFYNGSRGLYYDIDKIAPGAVAKDTDQLAENILLSGDRVAWDKKYGKSIRKFKRDFVSWEKGGAAAKVLEEVGLVAKS